MSEDVRSIGNWAEELGISDKQLKAALKAASIEADSKKGACSLYSRQSVEEALKA